MSPSDAFNTESTPTLGASVTVTLWPSRDLIVSACSVARSMVPRMRVGVCASATVTPAARREAISTATRSMMGSFQDGRSLAHRAGARDRAGRHIEGKPDITVDGGPVWWKGGPGGWACQLAAVRN